MKGLSFSQPMVKAWMEGRKTVTRRMMNPQPTESVEEIHGIWCEQWDVDRGDGYVDQDARPLKTRYLPGETVYIKEIWGLLDSEFHPVPLPFRNKPYYAHSHIVYKADHLTGNDGPDKIPWKSPMMMPEWAARSHARIVSVRPERVQEITFADAIKEGMMAYPYEEYEHLHGGVSPEQTGAIVFFKETWDTLHPGTWDQNPWVWRYELEKK